MALSLTTLPVSFAGAAVTVPTVVPRMGLGYPSPKDLSNDPPISEVLKVAKAEQEERLARLALQADGIVFVEGGLELALTLPGQGPFGFFDPFGLVRAAKPIDPLSFARLGQDPHLCMRVRVCVP